MTHPVSRLDRFLHAALWALAVILIPLAVLVGVGRELLPLVSGQKPAIEHLLTQKTGLQIRLGELKGEWHGLSPLLRAERVAIYDARHPKRPLLIVPSVMTQPDWWATLRDFSPRLRTTINGLQLTLAPKAGGGIDVVELAGLGQSDPAKARQALRWLLAQPGLTLLDNQLRWQAPGRPVQAVRDVRLQQFNGQRDYRLAAEFRLGDSQALQRALLVVSGDPLAWGQTPWQAYLQLQDLAAWQPWLSLLPASWDARLDTGQVKLWLNSQGGAPDAGTLVLNDVALSLQVPQRGQREVKGLHGIVSLRGHAGAWHVGADDLGGEINKLPLPLQRLAIDYADGRLVAAAARVSLEGMRGVVAREQLLPAALLKQLEVMQPTGWLPRLQLIAERKGSDWTLQSANAEFKALTVQATPSLPGVRGVAGWAQGNREGGLLYLDTRHAELNLHTLFREPVPVDVLRGGVRWLKDGKTWHVDSDVLQLTNVDANARLQFAVRVPEGRPQEAHLDLLAGLEQGRVARAWRYVPWHAAGDHTLAWLQRALLAGEATRGAFLYSGALHHDHHPGGRFDMQLQLKDATLDYVPGWPALRQLNGLLKIEGRELKVLADSARVMDATATEVRAVIPDLTHAVLAVDAKLAIDLTDLDRLLAESPLKRKTAQIAERLMLSGPASARLGLHIPLGSQTKGDPEVTVEADVLAGEVTLPGEQLTFAKVRGPVRFDTSTGLNGSLQGALWGRPTAITLDGTARGRQWWRQRVSVDGTVDAAALGRWAGTDLSPYVRGTSPVRVGLDVPVAAPGQTDLRINASLEGMRLLLPEPFAKPAHTALPFTYQGKLGGSEHLARASLGDDLQAGLGWRDGRLQRLLLRAGLPGVAWPDQPGLFVEARLPEVNLADWQGVLNGSNASAAAVSPAAGLPPFRQLSLLADRLVLGPHVLGSTRARIQKEGDGWQVRLTGLQPKSLPAWPATEMTATLRRSGEVWHADPLDLRLATGAFSGSLAWQGGSRAMTTIKGGIETKDLGRLLEQAGQSPFITSDMATVKGSLQWPGDPDAFALDRLQGSIEARLKSGRLVEISNINLVTRVFGLLNASNLLRRLRFDFTDITRKGLNYDQLTLQGELKEGVMKPARFDLDGPTVSMHGRGWVNLNTHEIDQQLRVGVPVSSAVPVVAGFLAGPLVGGALVAADLLLDKQLSRLTSVRYHVSGPWDALKVDDEVLEVADDKDKGPDKPAPKDDTP